MSAEPRPAARAIALRFAVAAFLIALDLWSKQAVFAWFAELQRADGPSVLTRDCHGFALHERYKVFGNWLAIMLSYNQGMAWGFNGIPDWLLVGGRAAAVLFLGWLVVRTSPQRRVLAWAFVLVLAGATGNLYDNLFEPPREIGANFGAVRDFIDVLFPVGDGWHFPTFNVADSCISVGAVLLLITSFTSPSEKPA